MKKTLQVAVGLIFNTQQEILLAWRDAHKIPGNCWEFPGGKVEAGETGRQALCRELFEEVAIVVVQARMLPSICHQYDGYAVLLQPWRVEKYQGTPQGAEGQCIVWAPLRQLRNYTLPSANYAIVDLLLQHKTADFSR